MKEGKLEIIKNGEYNNVTLKTKYERNGLKLKLDDKGQKQVKQRGLDNEEFVIITKKFAEGRPVETKFGTNYSVLAEYDGQDVSFWLKPIEHEAYAKVGGEGDKVKVTNNKVKKIHPTLGVEVEYDNLSFEKVE